MFICDRKASPLTYGSDTLIIARADSLHIVDDWAWSVSSENGNIAYSSASLVAWLTLSKGRFRGKVSWG